MCAIHKHSSDFGQIGNFYTSVILLFYFQFYITLYRITGKKKTYNE